MDRVGGWVLLCALFVAACGGNARHDAASGTGGDVGSGGSGQGTGGSGGNATTSGSVASTSLETGTVASSSGGASSVTTSSGGGGGGGSANTSVRAPGASGAAGGAGSPNSDGENCTVTSDYGIEGESCNVAVLCDAADFNLSCTHNIFDFSCTCDETGRSFVARDTLCESLTDIDFVGESCGLDLEGGDGKHDAITVTDTASEPAFTADPIDPASCASPTSSNENYSCSWQTDCAGVSVGLDCENPWEFQFGCRCLIEGRYYRGAYAQNLPDCSAFDVNHVFDICGLPTPE